MREARGVDFYVEWSSIVEAPTFAGSRDDMLRHLSSQRHDADNTPEMRLARCDETGTSCLWKVPRFPREGAWDDDGLIYEQRGTVTRANIFVLARRLMADPPVAVDDLIVPFPEDGPTP